MCTLMTPYPPTQGGWTALHLSAQEGNFDVVYVLVEANAHVNQQTKVRCMSSTCGAFVLLTNSVRVSLDPSSLLL